MDCIYGKLSNISNFCYGKLNKEIVLKDYTGTSSDTANVNISGKNIKVDVIKVPYKLTIIEAESLFTDFDGSKDIVLDLTPFAKGKDLEELRVQVEQDSFKYAELEPGAESNDLVFYNAKGDEISRVSLSPFIQQQSDLAITDTANETFVKNKSTKYLENTGEDGSSPYATQEWVRINGGKIDSISRNGELLDVVNKNVDIIVPNALNEKSTSITDTYSANYISSTFAPKVYFSNLYLHRNTDTSAILLPEKPEANENNYLTTTRTNIDFDFSTPTYVLTRTIETETEINNEVAMSIILNCAFNRSAEVQYSIGVDLIRDGNITQLSTNQLFTKTYTTDKSDFSYIAEFYMDVITDIAQQTVLYTNDILQFRIYAKQNTSTPLIGRIYTGYRIDNVDVNSFVRLNITAVSISTGQIADGAITLPKLNQDVLNYIQVSTKVDNKTIERNSSDELQAIGITSGTDEEYLNALSYKDLLDALTIERLD